MTIKVQEGAIPRLASRPLQNVKWAILHHSGTAEGNVEVFRAYHKSLGWGDVGYHYIITNGDGGPDGELQLGRDILTVGAHCPGRNTDSIGICLVGNFVDGSYATEEQLKTLASLLRNLTLRFDIPIEQIIGHKEAYATDCPGDLRVSEIRAGLRGENGNTELDEAMEALKIKASFNSPHDPYEPLTMGVFALILKRMGLT